MRPLPPDLKALVDAYGHGPSLLNEAIRGLDAGAINARRPGSDWSIRDNVLHVADMELLRAVRIRAVIAEEQPVLVSVDETLWTRRLQYLWRSVEAAISLFDHLCFTTVELLRWSDKAAWERTGAHPELGAVTVRELVARGAAHVDEHAAAIRVIREAIGK
ncbi:MAG: DinB family protein [Dehalococcoidia bacterium]